MANQFRAAEVAQLDLDIPAGVKVYHDEGRVRFEGSAAAIRAMLTGGLATLTENGR